MTKSPVVLAAAISIFGGAFAPFAANAQDATASPAPAPATSPAAPATPPTPAAAAASTAPNYNVQTSGLIDGYYMLSFTNPKGQSIIPGDRSYDIRNNTPTLALAELNVFKNPMPGGFGFKTTLIAGDVADLNHGGTVPAPDGTERRFKNIQQLYGSYAFAGAGGGIDFGKFYTPFGYEVTEANANYNYSRSLPFFLLPVYHAGLRAYTPSYHGLVVTGYLVNALFNTANAGVHDDNGTPAYIISGAYTDPAGKYTAISSLGLGKDKLGVNTKVTLSDNDFTYNLNSDMLLGANYTYIKLSPDGGAPSTTTNGYAVYYKQNLTPKSGFALRFSGFQSKTGDFAGPPVVTTTDTKPYEFTATYELRPATNFTTRLEYRHDNVNGGNGAGLAFADSSGAATKNSQDTVTLAGLFTF